MSLQTDNIDTLELNPKIIQALRKAQLLSQRHLLTVSTPDVERLTGLSSKDVLMVKDLISERLIQHKACTALDILHAKAASSLLHWKLPSQCPVIDNALRGGVLSGVITEISGESASGKTQLCLQLCISIQLHGKHGGGAVYICTEDVFPSKRLQQMIRAHSSRGAGGQNLGDRIFIEHVADFETLDFCVNKKLPTLLNRGLVKLVVIDSVAALFRCHYDSTQTVQRAKHLTDFASLLHQLAFQHNIPVVCVNQVSANMNITSSHLGQSSVTPALGLTWANQIACRIMLSRPLIQSSDAILLREKWNSEGNSVKCEPTYRKLKLVFAPDAAPVEISVYIDNYGIHGIPPT